MTRSAAARAALADAVSILRGVAGRLSDPFACGADRLALTLTPGADVTQAVIDQYDFTEHMARFGVEPDATLVFRLRLPRVLLAAEVGAALSIAGATLQALLRNPLADPFVFGLSGGAAIGAALAVAAGGTVVGTATVAAASWAGLLPAQLSAVLGALAAALLVVALGRSRGQLRPERALLVGVVFNSFASALVLSLEAILAPEKTQAVLLWLSGTLGYETGPVLSAAAVSVLLPALVLTALAGRLNLLALGEEGAAALGIDVEATRLICFIASSAASGLLSRKYARPSRYLPFG